METGMKDKLIDTLQERFAQHEMGVDPGTWNAISSQLAAANGSALSEVLKDKFTGHEAPVDPQVWDSISSQLGHGAAAGGGVAAGWWAGGLAAALLVGGLFWWSSEEQPVATTTPATSAQTTPSKAVPVQPEAIIPEAVTGSTTDPAQVSSAAKTDVVADAQRAERSNTSTKPDAEPAGEDVVNTVWQDLVQENTAEPHFAEREESVPMDVAPPVQLPSPSVVQLQPASTTQASDHPADDQQEETQDEVEPTFVEAQQPQVYIPNVFSPQGDGVNDRLKVVCSNYQKVLVRIFSAQSNALVFRANNLDDQWNGRDLNNVPCPEGYYFYAIEVTGTDGNTTSHGEVVKLFR
jgi:gliding motility-associated-like protein